MILIALPGATFEASIDNAPPGLVGQIGVRVISGEGLDAVARRTTGIVETPAGSGVYVATLTAPAVADSYLIVWDTGEMPVPAAWASEELLISNTVLRSTVKFAAPGDAFWAASQGAGTGGTGQIAVRLVDKLTGATVMARRTTGIIEAPAGSGIYLASLTAPAAPGSYLIQWDTGGAGAVFASEDLDVATGAVLAVDPHDLTTLDAVREFLQIRDEDIEQDTVISALITRASLAIMRHTGREFAPKTNDAERVFAYTGRGMLDLAPYEARAVTTVTIDSDLPSPRALTLGTNYRLRPLPAREGVYSWLEIVGYNGRRVRQVTIRGDWGWPAIPADVEQACITTVGIWLRRDVSAFSRTYSLDEGRTERPEALPAQVVAMLAPYRVPVIA